MQMVFQEDDWLFPTPFAKTKPQKKKPIKIFGVKATGHSLVKSVKLVVVVACHLFNNISMSGFLFGNFVLNLGLIQIKPTLPGTGCQTQACDVTEELLNTPVFLSCFCMFSTFKRVPMISV